MSYSRAQTVGDGSARGRDVEGSSASDVLTSLRMEKPSLMGHVLLAIGGGIFVGVLIAAPVALVASIWKLPPSLVGIGIAALIAPFLKLMNGLVRRRTQRCVDRILSWDPDPQANVRAATELLAYGNLRLTPISVMTRAMGKIGRIGKTYQLWWKSEPDPITPLTMVFEPRLLDEADVGFDELALAATSEGEPSDANAPEAPGRREDVLDMRRVQRNIRLKGGWLLLGVAIIVFAFTLVDALQRHTVTWPLLLVLVTLLLLLFGPARSGWFTTNHWLLVPGGVLHRKAKSRDRKVALHLFDRRRSVMTIYQQRNGVWLLAVADTDASETTIITDRERQLLLRAWLSPRKPPPVERLIDLA